MWLSGCDVQTSCVDVRKASTRCEERCQRRVRTVLGRLPAGWSNPVGITGSPKSTGPQPGPFLTTLWGGADCLIEPRSNLA